MLIDSHCHLQHCEFTVSLSDYLEFIHNTFSYLIDISTNIEEYLSICSHSLPNWILTAVGLCPEFSAEFSPQMKKNFENVLEKNLPVAIGEVGLDYHWDYGAPVVQEKLFRYQIESAVEHNLPLIIHSRDAYKDTFRVLSSYDFEKPVILHCFGYGPDEAVRFLENPAFYISFAGNITYKSAENLRRAALLVPDDRLLLETDSPYLSPVPKRGKTNLPEYIEFTYEFMAKLRNTPFEKLSKQILENFRRTFSV